MSHWISQLTWRPCASQGPCYTVRGCELLFYICAHLLYIYIYIHSINGSFQNVDFGICRIYVDIFRYSVYYQQTAFEDCFQEESWICVIYCFEYIYISVCVHIVIYIYIYIHMGFYIVYYIGNTHTHTYVYIYICRCCNDHAWMLVAAQAPVQVSVKSGRGGSYSSEFFKTTDVIFQSVS